MRRSAICLAVSILFIAVGVARANLIVTLTAVDRGWYDGGAHLSWNENYVVGDPIDDQPEYRNFMVFDLSGVTLSIASAEIILYNPAGGFGSDAGQETYGLFDVITDIGILTDGSGGIATFNDLGSGVNYGSYIATAADNASDFTIPLNTAAVADLNAALGGPFAIGGAITSLNAGDDNEMLLGYTNFGNLSQTRLALTLLPEPTTLSLLGLGLLAVARRRRKR